MPELNIAFAATLTILRHTLTSRGSSGTHIIRGYLKRNRDAASLNRHSSHPFPKSFPFNKQWKKIKSRFCFPSFWRVTESWKDTNEHENGNKVPISIGMPDGYLICAPTKNKTSGVSQLKTRVRVLFAITTNIRVYCYYFSWHDSSTSSSWSTYYCTPITPPHAFTSEK